MSIRAADKPPPARAPPRPALPAGRSASSLPPSLPHSLTNTPPSRRAGASLFFSVGLRFLYAFFPIFLYILGPLALLIATLVQVVALFLSEFAGGGARADARGLGLGLFSGFAAVLIRPPSRQRRTDADRPPLPGHQWT